ncbi:MAG: aminopeptidase [FCB group bacterium]|nr:aminopeptidase [FCB group bacterium]
MKFIQACSQLVLLILLAGASAVLAAEGGIPNSLIDRLNKTELEGAGKAMADVVANKSIKDVALNRERFIAHNSIVNHKIETGNITNQKSSGRCWIFAGFNAIRPQVMKKYDLKHFEFSQNYLMFWDKMEKANKFLQLMIDMADRPLDDRELEIVIDGPMGDGGWWTYFTDLVEKYGLVPKEAMPETYNSSATRMMNKLIILKVKEMSLQLRRMASLGAFPQEVAMEKEKMLAEIYRLLVMNLGQPPTEFVWRYESSNDSIGIVTHPKKFTPQSFFKEVIDVDLGQYVALFNYPGKDYYENYAMRLSRNMYDRPNFTILNVPIDTVKAYALKSVLDSTPVWFACDVGKENYSADGNGIMALDIYNYEEIYGVEFGMSKQSMMHMMVISPNHAMTFIGVDTADNKAEKWLVENSWGGDKGDDGVWYMYDGWFDRYLYGAIIHKKYLSKELAGISKKKPIELPPWDPMYPLNNLQ